MRFAHLSDCHIGCWRDPKLRKASIEAFKTAIDKCIEMTVDFIIISGDLFNTSQPSIDELKEAVIKLKQLHDRVIPVYLVAGSHDFSPSGKTMLDVLENAGLVKNVAEGESEGNSLKLKFVIDKKTGAKITGLLGKKGGLEKGFYSDLDKTNLEKEDGYKIFLFHTAIAELKTPDLEEMEAMPASLLPIGFDYYAGGHVHKVICEKQGKGLIVFPGPVFPTNFKEIEELGQGGFYIVTAEGHQTEAEFVPLNVYNVFPIAISCDNKTPEEVILEITEKTKLMQFNNTIVTVRLYGTLKSGRPSDINFKALNDIFSSKSAYFVMKNTAALKSVEFEEIKVDFNSVDDIEQKLIEEHAGKIKAAGMSISQEKELTKSLMNSLNKEKEEGERVADFETRLLGELKAIIG